MNDQPSRSTVLRYIMLALLVWGAVVATGAVLYGRTLLVQRAAVVMGFTLLFLGFWWAMLAHRQRRLNRDKSHPEAPLNHSHVE